MQPHRGLARKVPLGPSGAVARLRWAWPSAQVLTMSSSTVFPLLAAPECLDSGSAPASRRRNTECRALRSNAIGSNAYTVLSSTMFSYLFNLFLRRLPTLLLFIFVLWSIPSCVTLDQGHYSLTRSRVPAVLVSDSAGL